MNICYFCDSIANGQGMDFIEGLDLGEFVAAWDANPATPGHALVIPKRHAQLMRELTQQERQSLIEAVLALKEFITEANLQGIYVGLTSKYAGSKSEKYLARALDQLREWKRPPDGFNDGLNDGPAGGQTVPHFHWHVMPRWTGDVPDPQGGIRQMFPGMGNYHQGLD